MHVHVSGEPCEKEHSTCNGRNEMCIGRGPAWEADDYGYRSNKIIAQRQSDKAIELWQSSTATPISGNFWHVPDVIKTSKARTVRWQWYPVPNACSAISSMAWRHSL